MCVMSMVFDHYEKIIPDVMPWTVPTVQPYTPPIPGTFTSAELLYMIVSREEIEALKLLISQFREAVEAARVVDRLTNQPDCEDLEKKKLEQRVAALEAQLAQMQHESFIAKNNDFKSNKPLNRANEQRRKVTK